ncbi:QueT transporter family protein [Butyrivibrio sp. AE2032]|uniref:QueT transporter family protein n=1 Tax=Butyrivibrio sp. AE2032 TaxID=1458463 RepID=UPI0005501D56|nr:QueT transporter family protein [Butyrivibrio sp. AE2032]
MNKTSNRTLYIVHAAVIAALYVVLTAIAAGFDLASGAIQVRFSECLTILPYFTNAAVPGVTLGCLIANIVTGSAMPDVIFGTLATLVGAVGSYLLRKNRFLVSIPPVLANAIIIPFVLKYAYGIEGSFFFFALTVGAGEIITCVIFGQILISALKPIQGKIFGVQADAVAKQK